MKKLLLSILILSTVACLTTGCGSLTSTRLSYNQDGSPREEVRLRARTLFSKDSLRGLEYRVDGGTNDVSRSLTIDAIDRDVSTNSPVTAEALGNAFNAVITPITGR